MLLGGFQPLTLIDFPGQVACVVFTQGCNLRCGYCHNPGLLARQVSKEAAAPAERQVFGFLEQRHGLLDGVVISGGEPTIQEDLIEFLCHVRELGFLTKLDTNGTRPAVLREALERGLLDYVAMDVKHDPARYAEIAGVSVDPSDLAASRNLILNSGVDHEFRTTIVPQIHDESAMAEIARFCAGASRFVLQGVLPRHAMEPSFRDYAPPTDDHLRQRKQIAEQFVDNVQCQAIS